MQKLNEKKILGTVPKKLQLVKTFWDCPEFSKEQNNQKGITLIALIITIIVMLILVGVTINVALNGGLFQKADEATRATEEKAILEEMLAMMELTDEGKIDYSAIITKIGQKYAVEYTYPNVTITGKLGTYTYIVSETEIKIGSSNVDYSSELERYFFNDDGTGKTGLVLQDENTGAITFNNDANTIADASTSILFMNYGEGYITIEYKGADYRIDVENMESIDTVSAIIGEDNEKVTKLETIYSGEKNKIEQYFLGYSGTGKYFVNLLDMELSTNNPVFKDNDIISDASSSVMLASGSEGKFTIIYKDTLIYNIIYDTNTMIITFVEKIEIEEKTYPVAYSTADNSIIMIQTSYTEGYVWMESLSLGLKLTIQECYDLTKLDTVDSVVMNGINYYSNVWLNNAGEPAAIYSDIDDKLYQLIYTNKTVAIDDSINFAINEDIKEEQINSIIETINESSN